MEPEQWETSCERVEGSTVEFSVTIPENDVEEQRKQALNELKQEVEEPGFRKGKVPDSIIKKKYSNQLKQTLLEKLVPFACQQAYERHDIQPVSDPSITDFDINGTFFMEATVEERPQVEVDEEQYIGISVKKEQKEVDEDAVEEQLEKMLDESSNLERVEEKRPVETGDFVKIDFKGRDEDGNVVEGTEGKGTVVEVGSERFLEEIEEGIIGAEPGDELEIDASFPDDFVDDSLAGETLTFEVEIKEIQEQRKPEPDSEEFLEEVGAESLGDLKENIRERLREAGDRELEEQMSEQIYEHLLDRVEFEVPEILIEREIEGMIDQQKQQLEQQGRNFQDYLNEQNISESDLEEEARPQAERRIRLTLIFQAIAEEEQVEVSDEEFEQHLEDLSAQYGIEVDELKDNLPDQQLRNIRFELRDQNILDYLIEEADVTTITDSDSDEKTDEE